MRLRQGMTIAATLVLGIMAPAAAGESFDRMTIDLEVYDCAPCVELGYVQAFEDAAEQRDGVVDALARLESERSMLEAQLEVKEQGVAAVRATIARFEGLLGQVNRELAPSDREESARGFDEIDILEREKAAGRKLSTREKKRLNNLKEKRRDFRDRRNVVTKNKRRKDYIVKIADLRLQIAQYAQLPPAPVLRRLLETNHARIAAQAEQLQRAEARYAKAKRELIFCTDHFELRRILREHGIAPAVPCIVELDSD